MRGALGLRSSLLGSSFSKHPQSGRGLEESLHKFVGAVNDVVRMCFKTVEKIKGQQLKMVRSYDIFGNSWNSQDRICICKSWQLYK